MKPLVSVCTPSWQRHDLLRDTMRHIREQTYPNLEHCIVIDGQDCEALEIIEAESRRKWRVDPESLSTLAISQIPTRYAELGRNWTTYLEHSRHAAPMMVAQLMASGEYLTWLADDERMDPDHIERLVNLLEETGADFVYSMTRMWHVKTGRERSWIIGTDPPRHGQITNVLYRATLIEKGLTRLGAGYAPDWDQIEQWIANGATWAFLPEVTFEHRADQ